MTHISPVIGSDYTEIHLGDPMPSKGIVLLGTLVYSDGELCGRLHSDVPQHAAIEWVLDGRGEWVQVYFRPLEPGQGEAT